MGTNSKFNLQFKIQPFLRLLSFFFHFSFSLGGSGDSCTTVPTLNTPLPSQHSTLGLVIERGHPPGIKLWKYSIQMRHIHRIILFFKRFFDANSPISYFLHVRFVSDKIDQMDKQALMPLLRQSISSTPQVLHNGLGEQLRLLLKPSVTPNHGLSKEEQSQVAKTFGLHIERLFG